MATLWDALIRGYNNPGGDPATPSSDTSAWDKLISLLPSSGNSGRQVVDHDYVVDGLVKRGLPQHVAEGFAMNFADESGFDSGINELNPVVEGSRGGFGLYQLTGPRRRAYESYASAKGVDVADPDAQLDFLVRELETTERGAAKRILGTKSSGEAGAAIVNHFLRPAKTHRENRASKYLGSSDRAKPEPLKLWLDF